MPQRNKWYALSVNAFGEAEISVFDEIGGWGVSVADFKEQFDLIKDKPSVRLLLNSPGGAVTEGMAFYNLMASIRSKLTVEVIGLAASMASIVALSGKELVMGEGTYFMIHNPWTIAWGDSEELRKSADILDTMKAELTHIYAAHSDLSDKEITAMMDAETWLTADDAVAKGFATSVKKTSGKAAALIDWNFSQIGFKRAPLALTTPHTRPTTVREFEVFLRDAGYTRAEASAITAIGFRPALRDAGGWEDVAAAVRRNIDIFKGD